MDDELLNTKLQRLEADVTTALCKVESRLRTDRGLPPYPAGTPVWLPTKDPRSLLRLMNLRVWSLRYCISLEFILDVLLDVYRNARHLNPLEREHTIQLGLPLTLITGPVARQRIEEALAATYPGHENFRVVQHHAPPAPLDRISYNTTEEMTAQYQSVMTHRQKALVVEPTYNRNWRKPWRSKK